KLDRAGDLVAHAGQDFRNAEENGHVRVVSAGVHDADVVSVEGGAHGGFEGKVDLLDDRKRVHVGAKCDHASRLAAAEKADDAGVRNGRLDLDAELAQTVRDDPGCA